MPPISYAVAMTSVPFQSSVPLGRPNAAYSPGIRLGFVRASSM